MLVLFFSSFLAATLFPAQSELGLAYLVASEPSKLIALVGVASLGNTLGSAVNWAIGIGVIRFAQPSEGSGKVSRWYRMAQTGYERYGYWSLLISWMPLIGDPVTLVAGLFKEPLWRFLLLVSLAKTLRYIAVAVLALQLV